ncbi:MAG: DUF58 domain-containing protein, partial [Lentisphaeraceae bacterium]|nr:DUF58 domain-containing protein [Lentisphaeraceae bacterium]
VEFSQYRKYVQGDDISRIDWRVFGRTEKYFVKEYEADTNLRAYMVLDCSGSMGFEGKDGTKFQFARTLVATLAQLLVQQGDSVGMYAFNDKMIKELPPRTSPKHLYAINETLDELKPHGKTDLIHTLHNLAAKVRRRALIIIFSDFFSDVDELIDSFSHLQFKKHDVAVFHIMDEAELQFAMKRPVRFMDMEGSGSLIADPAIIRDEYLDHLDEYLNKMRVESLKHKVDYRLCIPGEGAEKALSEFLIERLKGGH